MATMTAKDLRIAVKRDNAMEYLMSRFGISDSDHLLEAMRKVDPLNADELFKKMFKKYKRSQRRDRETTCTNMVEVVTQEEAAEVLEEDESEEIEQDDLSAQVLEESVEEEEEQEEQVRFQSQQMSLDQLLKEEKELSDMLIAVEVKHKELVSERQNIVVRLSKAQKALEELRRILDCQEQNVLQLYKEYEAAANQMEALNEDRRIYEEFLDEIRKNIANCSKVTIFIYENGTIEVENGDPIAVFKEDIASSFNKLISLPEAEEYTIKELKTIAKLRVMVDAYTANKQAYELEFGSDRVRNLWQTVTA